MRIQPWVAFGSIVLIALARPAAAAPAAGSGRDALVRAVRALGGEEALAKVSSYQVTIRRNIRSSADGIKYVTIEESFQAPDLVRKVSRVELAGRGGYAVASLQVYDGAAGWSDENEKREMTRVAGGALVRVRRVNLPRFGLLRQAARGDVESTLLGRVEVNGRKVDRVRIAHPQSEVVYDLDPDTARPVRLEIVAKDYREVVVMDDYQPAGGLTLPFRIETLTHGATEEELMEDRLTEVRMNPVLPASLFQSPVEP